jgi:hypothetical protein
MSKLSPAWTRFQRLLHSGALFLFIAASLLYGMQHWSIVFGLLGVLVECFAWLRWLLIKEDKQTEQEKKESQEKERNRDQVDVN